MLQVISSEVKAGNRYRVEFGSVDNPSVVEGMARYCGDDFIAFDFIGEIDVHISGIGPDIRIYEVSND